MVINDGGQREQVESTVRPCLGLAGLRERVNGLGGCMEASPLTLSGTAHFRLYVELPLQGHETAQAGQGELS